MKKKYTAPEVCLVKLGEEIMDGLTQKSVDGDGGLPDGTNINGNTNSNKSDDPEAKIGGRFWDDEY